MVEPNLTDYINMIFTLFDEFEQLQIEKGVVKKGRPYTYTIKCFVVLFMMLQYKRIHEFAAQARWVEQHQEILARLGWDNSPHRTTFSRRYQQLGTDLTDFIHYVGQSAVDLGDEFANDHLVEDKSLFQAQGPVWHQSDRKENRVPKGLRNLDKEATWSKSAYQGWVYGYGLHMTCTESAFPKLLLTETASFKEGTVLSAKSGVILNDLNPVTLAADDGYTKAMRIRNWAKKGVILLTPALRWVKGKYAQAYHRFIKEADNAQRLQRRRTSVEPLFDLIAYVCNCKGKSQQLPVQGLANVRALFALATLSIQIAMIVNSLWQRPLRNISHMRAVFA